MVRLFSNSINHFTYKNYCLGFIAKRYSIWKSGFNYSVDSRVTFGSSRQVSLGIRILLALITHFHNNVVCYLSYYFSILLFFSLQNTYSCLIQFICSTTNPTWPSYFSFTVVSATLYIGPGIKDAQCKMDTIYSRVFAFSSYARWLISMWQIDRACPC